MLDRIDRAIMRLLLKHKMKFLSTNEIAIKIGVAPLTAKRDLEKLKNEGYVADRIQGQIREYDWKYARKKKKTKK